MEELIPGPEAPADVETGGVEQTKALVEVDQAELKRVALWVVEGRERHSFVDVARAMVVLASLRGKKAACRICAPDCLDIIRQRRSVWLNPHKLAWWLRVWQARAAH